MLNYTDYNDDGVVEKKHIKFACSINKQIQLKSFEQTITLISYKIYSLFKIYF